MLDRTRNLRSDETAPAGETVTLGALPAIDNEDLSNHKNLALLILLRWIAVVGQVATIAFAGFVLRVSLPFAEMGVVLGALVVLNLSSMLWLRRQRAVPDGALCLALLLDVGALALQLYFSGGATNPFVFLFLLHVMLGAVLLGTRLSMLVVATTGLCFALLTVAYRPLVLSAQAPDVVFRLQILGLFICFFLDATLLMTFVSRINRNLSERDARLAALRQHAVEEEHIVRMGLLASGAAHELGTPLASISVILGDWRRLPALAADPAMAQELDDMQAEIRRCKAIVTGILLSAGEARGEAPRVTTMNAFLDGLVADWRAAHPAAVLRYHNAFGEDASIVSDPALKQVLHSVLDNAFEASPNLLEFTVTRAGQTLELEICDRGPGFTRDMLARLGKPYHSSKGRLGGGLGLFLVVNVVRKLGGTVTAANRPGGGARIGLALPISALALSSSRHVR